MFALTPLIPVFNEKKSLTSHSLPSSQKFLSCLTIRQSSFFFFFFFHSAAAAAAAMVISVRFYEDHNCYFFQSGVAFEGLSIHDRLMGLRFKPFSLSFVAVAATCFRGASIIKLYKPVNDAL